MGLHEAKDEFRFWTRIDLIELTGRRAYDLQELLAHIRQVDGAVIFHHTHHFIQEMGFLENEPTSDFAQWVGGVLRRPRLAEHLAAVDPCAFGTIRELRESIVTVIEEHLASQPETSRAPEGLEFHFLRTISLPAPTSYVATNLYEFAEALQVVSAASLSYHLFDARLRLENASNDFSRWLRESVDCQELADRIDRLSPYASSLEGLRAELIHLVESRIYRTVRRREAL